MSQASNMAKFPGPPNEFFRVFPWDFMGAEGFSSHDFPSTPFLNCSKDAPLRVLPMDWDTESWLHGKILRLPSHKKHKKLLDQQVS